MCAATLNQFWPTWSAISEVSPSQLDFAALTQTLTSLAPGKLESCLATHTRTAATSAPDNTTFGSITPPIMLPVVTLSTSDGVRTADGSDIAGIQALFDEAAQSVSVNADKSVHD